MQKKIDKELQKKQQEYVRKMRLQMQQSALQNTSSIYQDPTYKSSVQKNSLLDQTFDSKGKSKQEEASEGDKGTGNNISLVDIGIQNY